MRITRGACGRVSCGHDPDVIEGLVFGNQAHKISNSMSFWMVSMANRKSYFQPDSRRGPCKRAGVLLDVDVLLLLSRWLPVLHSVVPHDVLPGLAPRLHGSGRLLSNASVSQNLWPVSTSTKSFFFCCWPQKASVRHFILSHESSR